MTAIINQWLELGLHRTSSRDLVPVLPGGKRDAARSRESQRQRPPDPDDLREPGDFTRAADGQINFTATDILAVIHGHFPQCRRILSHFLVPLMFLRVLLTANMLHAFAP